MVNLNKLTRKQLAALIVDNQIVRGIVKRENRDYQINVRLNGFQFGLIKPMTKAELVQAAEAFLQN